MGCFPKDDVIAKLDRASFIHPLPESVLSSTEGARPQGALWSHLFLHLHTSWQNHFIACFSTTDYSMSMDSKVRKMLETVR